MTGMDTRIGYPNEHLANEVPDEMAMPMFATGIGLVIVGLNRNEKELDRIEQTDSVGKNKKENLK